MNTSVDRKSFWEKGTVVAVAVLHEIGSVDDPEVVVALEGSCGKCEFFQRR